MKNLAGALNESTIKVGVEAADWQQAVRAAGQLLLDDGSIEPRYIEAMIQAIHEMGPYVVLAPGIALAHSRPEDGVKDVCISLVRLAEPVEFGSEVNDPVDLVFALGGVDKESHLVLLRELALLLQDEDSVEHLRTCRSAAEAVEIVRSSSDIRP